MDTPLETHYFGDNMRIVVDYDRDADNPRNDDPEYVGMFPVRPNRHYRPFQPGQQDVTYRHLLALAERYGPTTEEFHTEVEKFFTGIGHNFVRKQFFAHRDVVGTYIVYSRDSYTTLEHIQTYIAMLDAWLAGEVYTLTRQLKQKYVSLSTGRELEVWENDTEGEYVCQIGGVYMDNISDAHEVQILMNDNFEYTNTNMEVTN